MSGPGRSVSWRYLGRRLFQALLTILAIVVLNFVLFRMLPGDPVNTLLPKGPGATPERKEAIREQLGLDLPILPGFVRSESGGLDLALETLPESLYRNQLVASITALFWLPPELGDSFAQRRPVGEVIAERFWPTVLLVLSAEVLAMLFGVLIGVRAGSRRGGWFDKISVGASLGLYAIPFFWLGMLLLFFLATPNGVPLFPSQQMVTPGREYASGLEYAVDIAAHLVLPASALALGLLASYALIMRSSLIEVLSEDYITTARAKGLRESLVLKRHAIPNALLPTVTLATLSLGYTLGGAIGVEQVFAWPGMGRLTIEAVAQKDFPVLQGVFLLITISVVLANLLADILYGLLDPRVRT